MFVNNESTAGVGNDKPVSILSDHFILSCFLDVAVITPMKSHATLEIMQLICMPEHGEREFEFI